MRARSLRLGILYATAIAALAGAVAWPPSRSIIAQDACSIVGLNHDRRTDVPAGPAAQRRAEAYAADHPNDAGLHLAALLFQAPLFDIVTVDVPPGTVPALRRLAQRFPSSPMIAALVVRADAAQLRIGRAHDDLLDFRFVAPPPPAPGAKPAVGLQKPVIRLMPPVPAPPAAQTAAMDADCQTGERLDPDNGFFPAMRAIELYAARDDTAAHAELARAARSAVWRDYQRTQRLAVWGLYHRVYPQSGAVERLYLAMPEFGYLPSLREIARLTVSQAMQAEKQHHIAAGIELRRELARLGVLMCFGSRRVITALIGKGVFEISTADPGGAAITYQPYNAAISPEQREARNVSRFLAWLRANGDGRDAAWYASEFGELGVQRAHLDAALLPRSDALMAAVQRRLIWGFVDFEALLAILATMAFGMIGSRTVPWLVCRAPNGLQPAVGRVITIGLATAAPGMCLYWYGPSAVGVTIAAGIVMAACIASTPWRFTLHWSAWITAAALGLGALLAAVMVGLAHLVVSAFGAGMGISATLASGSGESGGTVAASTAAMQGFASLAFLAVPAAFAFVFALLSIRWKTPVSLGIARGFRGVALPAAAVLTILFAGLCWQTGRAETVAFRMVTREQTNEFASMGIKPRQNVYPAPTG